MSAAKSILIAADGQGRATVIASMDSQPKTTLKMMLRTTFLFGFAICFSLLNNAGVEASTLVAYIPVGDKTTTTAEYETAPQNHQIQSTYSAYVAALEETGAYSTNQVYIVGPDWTTLTMNDAISQVSLFISLSDYFDDHVQLTWLSQ